MTDCPRRDAWLRGCRFEPRYDRSRAQGNLNMDGATIDAVAMAMDACRDKTYIRDICTTCGRTIEREGR